MNRIIKFITVMIGFTFCAQTFAASCIQTINFKITSEGLTEAKFSQMVDPKSGTFWDNWGGIQSTKQWNWIKSPDNCNAFGVKIWVKHNDQAIEPGYVAVNPQGLDGAATVDVKVSPGDEKNKFNLNVTSTGINARCVPIGAAGKCN